MTRYNYTLTKNQLQKIDDIINPDQAIRNDKGNFVIEVGEEKARKIEEKTGAEPVVR
jgi:hypothetical protein